LPWPQSCGALRELPDLQLDLRVDLLLLHIITWKHTDNVNDLADRFDDRGLFVAHGKSLLCHPEVCRELALCILKGSPQIVDDDPPVWVLT
jgi:hypothetical protein